ncbi:MAG: protein kinase [Lactobacillales bacterium]|nr:protein kinase [Lactobacillales bacterium]
MRQSKGGKKLRKSKKVWIVIAVTSGVMFLANSVLAHQTGQSLFSHVWRVVGNVTNQLISFIHEEEEDKLDSSTHHHRIKSKSDDSQQSDPQKRKPEDSRIEVDPDPMFLSTVGGLRNGFAFYDDLQVGLQQPVVRVGPLVDELEESLEEVIPSIVETVKIVKPARPAIVQKQPRELSQVPKSAETNDRPDDKMVEPVKKPRRTRKGKPEKVYSHQEILSQQMVRKEHFFGEMCMQDFSDVVVDPSQWQLLGSGAFGNVYKASIKGLDVIVKTGISGDNSCLDQEWEASESLRISAEAKIKSALQSKSGEGLAEFQGFSGIVLVIGRLPDDSIVQQRIAGCDLRKAVENPKVSSFYREEDGFPKDLLTPKQMALQFAMQVMAIHEAGKVHCDLKAPNCMIDEEGYLHIIDLGNLRDVGSRMPLPDNLSKNLAPEIQTRWELLGELGERNGNSDLSNELDELRLELRRMRRRKAFEEQLAEKQRQIDELNRQFEESPSRKEEKELEQEINEFKADYAYDIYTGGTVFPELFYGTAGKDMAQQFWEGSKRYRHAIDGLNFDGRVGYFSEQVKELEDQMSAATGSSYGLPFVQQFSELMAGVMAPEPEERPNAKEVALKLMEINGISTKEESHELGLAA